MNDVTSHDGRSTRTTTNTAKDGAKDDDDADNSLIIFLRRKNLLPLVENTCETCNESWIIFASLYGKPRVTRNGNNEEINSR